MTPEGPTHGMTEREDGLSVNVLVKVVTLRDVEVEEVDLELGTFPKTGGTTTTVVAAFPSAPRQSSLAAKAVTFGSSSLTEVQSPWMSFTLCFEIESRHFLSLKNSREQLALWGFQGRSRFFSTLNDLNA
ncbi:MAG: hypothetical protein Q9165_000360 [Trypethelium subeluteriae]